MPLVSTNFLARLFRGAPEHQVSNLSELAAGLSNQTALQPYMSQSSYCNRAILESPGVQLSSCEVHGDRHNPKYLPILPADYSSLYSTIVNTSGSLQNEQAQSPFFVGLLPEIRQLIYCHLFGDRRVHLDFDYESRQAQWLWWHRICDSPNTCPDKQLICPENATAEGMMLHFGSKSWMTERVEAKIDAVGWLRSCRLGTNIFFLTHGIDQIHRVSRVIPRHHLELLTSLVVEIDVYRISRTFPGMSNEFAEFYREFFETFEGIMSGLRSMSLTIAGLPRSPALVEWSNENEEMWIGPWERLKKSRQWEKLEIAVPPTWYKEFEEVIGRRGQLRGNGRFSLIEGEEPFRRGW
ncbi:hypothetical protein BJX64DRAFT_276113 [Aspergillus heterothallicus]